MDEKGGVVGCWVVVKEGSLVLGSRWRGCGWCRRVVNVVNEVWLVLGSSEWKRSGVLCCKIGVFAAGEIAKVVNICRSGIAMLMVILCCVYE